MSGRAKVTGVTGKADDYPHKDLTERIIGCAINVHRDLGPGSLESIYENALAHELGKAGLQVERQVATDITYDGIVCGQHRLDLLVDGQVIVELKHVDGLHDKHLAQVISTLKAFGIPVGLLINFNEAKLVNGIRRVVFSAKQ